MSSSRMAWKRKKENGSQFKDAARNSAATDSNLRPFVLQVAERMVGTHDVNEALISFVLEELGTERQRRFVEAAVDLFDLHEVPARPEEKLNMRCDPHTIREFSDSIGWKITTMDTLPLGEKAEVDEEPPRSLSEQLRDHSSISQIGTVVAQEIHASEDPAAAEAKVEDVLRELLADLRTQLGVSSGAADLSELADAFALGPDEQEVILFLLAYKNLPHFEAFCDQHQVSDWPRLMATGADIPLKKVLNLLAEDGGLKANGLIKRGDDDDFSPFYALSAPVCDYLSGLSECPLSDLFVKVDTEETYPVDSFILDETHRSLVQTFIDQNEPCHILLHGQAGTGKTEFARAIINEAKKKVYFVLPGEDGKPTERRVALAGGAHMARPSESVLIVDEADSLLNAGHNSSRNSVDKGWVNTFMDHCPAVVIWITNDMHGVPNSILRRFNFAIEFKSLNRHQRVAMWDRVLLGTRFDSMLDGSTRERLAISFQVDAAGISAAVNDADRLLDKDETDPSTAEALLTTLLSSHQKLVTGLPPKEPITTACYYRPDALNIDGDRGAIEESLKAAIIARERGDLNTRINLLFWGPPGTGKSEYARHLACTLGKNLVVKTASELLDAYVGNTEKLIRAAFEEARADDAVLFIDEADSFFTDRATANRSWEVSRTNELLQQMERHDGILICCTNFLHGLDKAALRRFDWKVEFKALDEPRLLITYEEYFSAGRPALNDEQRRRLTSIVGVTFGDFRAVVGRFRFLVDANLTHDTLIDALQAEVAYRKGPGTGRRLGFA